MTFYKIILCIFQPIFRLLFNYRVYGRENIPSGNVLVCANHTAYRDPILVASAVKKDIRFLAKDDLQRFIVFKALFKLFGIISIRRGESDRKAISVCCDVLKRGETLGIFPQGTRTVGVPPSPSQAKAGIALIASMTKATVLPVRIVYKNNVPKMFGKTKVIIGKPIPFDEYSVIGDGKPSKQEMTEYIFDKLCKL